jgi:hypothetical protein
MTLVSNFDAPAEHVGELRLRRFRLGELTGDAHDEIARHTAGCGACRARLESLGDEQKAFEQEIPFARFAGGVERAHRVPGASRPEVQWRARPRRRFALYTVMSGLAAAAALVLVVSLPRAHRDGDAGHPARNNIKGGARLALVRIGGGEPREASASGVESLRPGESLRLGYRTPDPAFVAVLSIDDAGVVTPLYPEHGPSLPAAPSAQPTFLPDSIELTGHGRERVYLVLTDQPLGIEQLAAAVKGTFARAGGDLGTLAVPSLPPSAAPGLEVHSWLFAKP